MPQGVLILISGPALAGKSTFLEALSQRFPSIHIVSTDDIRDEFFHSFAYVIENEPFIWKTAYQRIHDHLEEGHHVCLDATLRTATHRQEIKDKFKDVRIVYFAFENPPLDVLLKRNQARTWKQFSEDAIVRMHSDYQFPSIEEQKTFALFFIIPYPSSITSIDDYMGKLTFLLQ
jgi:predicted kinase